VYDLENTFSNCLFQFFPPFLERSPSSPEVRFAFEQRRRRDAVYFYWNARTFFLSYVYFIGKRRAENETGCILHCPGLGPLLSSGTMLKGLDGISFEQEWLTAPNC